jgi:hypothetical protein
MDRGLTVALCICVVGLIGGGAWATYANAFSDLPKKMHRAIFIACAAGVATALGIAWVYAFEPPPASAQSARITKDAFATLAKKYPELGEPTKSAPNPNKSIVVESLHENGAVFWFFDTGTAYYAPTEDMRNRGQSGLIVSDNNAENESTDLHEARYRANQFPDCYKRGLKGPSGGVAKRWLTDPAKYRWIGCERFSNGFNPGEISYQRFDHGIIIGPGRTNIEERDNLGKFYAFSDRQFLGEIGRQMDLPPPHPGD